MNRIESNKTGNQGQQNLKTLIDNIFLSLDKIYKFRFIEKISRPISGQDRQKIVTGFIEYLQKLHTDLQTLTRQSHRFKVNHGYEKVYQNKNKINSISFKHYIVRISGKYKEVNLELFRFFLMETLNTIAKQLKYINYPRLNRLMLNNGLKLHLKIKPRINVVVDFIIFYIINICLSWFIKNTLGKGKFF